MRSIEQSPFAEVPRLASSLQDGFVSYIGSIPYGLFVPSLTSSGYRVGPTKHYTQASSDASCRLPGIYNEEWTDLAF